MPTRFALLSAVWVFLTNGCFLGYDSRWGQQKRAQQNFVQAEAPNTLRRDSGAKAAAASKRARVRVFASRAYTAEILDWQRRFARVVDDANAILGPILDVQIEVVESKPWPMQGDDDKVENLITKLRETDRGEDVDWVIGLASAMPRFESSFHELGAGELIGKHIVLRAINNAAEYQAIEEGLSELSQQERDRFRSARLAHKLTTVLLHELGHTLGALHEQNAKSIMNPAYTRETTGYSSAAIDLMRLVYAHRSSSGTLDDTARPALVDILRREPTPFVQVERDVAIKRYGQSNSMPTTAPSAVAAQPLPAEVAALSESEQCGYSEARALKDARKFAAARERVKPLLEAYPSNMAVQELRCQIASQQGLAWKQIEAECAEFMKLQRQGAAKH